MKCSVIVPLYNKRASVCRALDSVLGQTYPAHEVIVVDDGSTDGSADEVTQYGNAVRLQSQVNAGPSAARNAGAHASTGTELLFLDADDELAPEALANHARAFEQHPLVDVSLGSCVKVDPSGVETQECVLEHIKNSTKEYAFLSRAAEQGFFNVASGSICINHIFFDQIGGFDEQLRCWEISDFMLRVWLNARSVGLHGAISLTVHTTESDGQFAATRGDVAYRVRFAERIAERLSEIPEPARTAMLQHGLRFAYTLWNDGNLPEFKSVYRRFVSFLGPTERKTSLYRYHRLPMIALKPLHSIRRAVGRQI
jgi:glycosyltransferase involved in cell wall biosynthesis